MKILFVTGCHPTPKRPQYGIFIKQQADALRRLGHRVDVLLPYLGKDPTVKHFVRDGVELYSIQYRVMRYDLFPLAVARKARKTLHEFLGSSDYDLVAVHIAGDIMLNMVVDSCNRLNIPVVAHYHGLNVWEEFTTKHPYRQKFYAKRRERILKKASAVVGVSEKVTELLRQRIRTIPARTVYNGVDLSLFSGAARKGKPFRIIGVGNLIEIKGFVYLLDAFAKLHKQNPNTLLDIVGEGVLAQKLKDCAEELGVTDSVTFHGKLLYEDVAKLMGRSDLFVLPSFYEALGCVYLEAMGCGLPTIGVRGMGIDEIIVHGENGLLVEPKNSEDLLEKMRQVATDPELAEKLSQNGRKTAEKYTWDASGAALEALYKEIVAK